MAIRARGVQETRTLSAVLCSGVHSNERHVRQFQVAALELERTRRVREKQAAMRRVNDIDARLAQIDALIRKHQEALGSVNIGSSPDGEAPAPSDDATTRSRRVLRYGG